MEGALERLTLQEALQTAGYLLGTILHILLLWLFLRRHRRRPGESLFAGFVCAVGFWNFGQFFEVFFGVLLRGKVPTQLAVSCDIIAYLGLLLLPSTLLHTLGSLIYTREQRGRPKPWMRVALFTSIGLIYSPVFYLPKVIDLTLSAPGAPGMVQLKSIIGVYLGWFVSAFLISALLSLFLARSARGYRERVFYQTLIFILLGTVSIVSFLFLFGYDSVDKSGIPLELVIIALSTLPSAMFGYYVHRYDDVEFFLRRSLFYIVLFGVTVLVYLWGISVIAELLDKRYGLNRKLIEAVLVLALIFLFHPFRKALNRVFNRIFFKQTFAYQKVLSELVTFMGQGTATHVREIVLRVANSVSAALDLEASEIVLIAPSGVATYSTDRKTSPPTVEACRTILVRRQWLYFRRADLGAAPLDLAALEEVEELGAEAIVAVRHQKQVVALFIIGSKRDTKPLFAEEIDLLLALSQQLSVALKGLKLFEEKQLLERQLYKTEQRLALGRFSSSVAHRVKNPLSSIKAITQSMALDFAQNDERRQDLLLVVSEVDRLNGIVDQLLNYAEAENHPDRAGWEIVELINEVSALFQHEADLFGVAIVSELSKCPRPIRGNRTDLREILSNLIQNGIHAMENGGTLLVKVVDPSSSLKAPGSLFVDLPDQNLELENWCLLAIIDEGSGVCEDQKLRIFDPFFTTKPQGTGLGLAIAKRRIAELGGAIAVSDRDDQKPGAVMWLCVPLLEKESETLAKEALSKTPPP
jgi:signal transduction histidine kinase